MMRGACILGAVALLLWPATTVSGRKDDDRLPENLRGFSGQVRGVVAARHDDNSFTFKVVRVLKVWDGNEAEEPKSIAGRSLRVGPRWAKGDDGRWRPLERHVAYARRLKVGEEMTLEIRNVEGDRFQILELSHEQRARAEKQRPEQRRGDRIEREGQEREEKAETEAREREILIKVLRDEIRRLHAENAELRRLLKQRERGGRERRD